MWIAVLGMHRSGTSAIAGILHTLGYQFGETKQALEPSKANAKGYWERKDVMEINDAILGRQGCAWDQLTRFHVNIWKGFNDTEMEQSVRRILSELDSEPAGFIKDPRICLTLPVWARISPPALLIWMRRSPSAVARSLQARQDCSFAAGIALWEAYENAIQTWAQKWPTIQVHFEAFQADPWAESLALAHALQKMGAPPPRQPDRVAISSWFDPTLIRNESFSDADYMCPPSSVLNYQFLPVREQADRPTPPPLSSFARENLAYHEKAVSTLITDLRFTTERIAYLEDRLDRLVKAESAFTQSRLCRIMRHIHRLGCWLSGQPRALQPMDKIHAILHEES